jgi:hypothetical protein
MQIREAPPSYTQSHEPQTINLPTVPSTEPSQFHYERTLPPLSATALEPLQRHAEVVDRKLSPTPWPSSNPLSAYYQPTTSHTSPTTPSAVGMHSPNPMDMDSDLRSRRGGSVLSMDDPDVRLAAEALGDLRAGKVSSIS